MTEGMDESARNEARSAEDQALAAGIEERASIASPKVKAKALEMLTRMKQWDEPLELNLTEKETDFSSMLKDDIDGLRSMHYADFEDQELKELYTVLFSGINSDNEEE